LALFPLSYRKIGTFESGFKQLVGKEKVDVEEEILELEQMFECFTSKVCKNGLKKGECAKPKGEIAAFQPSVLA